MKKYTQPTIEHDDGPRGGYDMKHDAYGVIRMTTVTGGNSVLFGSDIGHAQRVRIEVSKAYVHRSLANDWIHGNSQPLIEFEMSFAQFAQFITSTGNGTGTPVTLQYFKGESIPGIEPIETKNDTFKREIKESANEKVAELKAEIKRLGELIASGKTPKKELQDIHRNMDIKAGHFGGNVAFVVEQGIEALEKATSDAKIEVESYINNAITKMGVEAAKNIGLIAKD